MSWWGINLLMGLALLFTQFSPMEAASKVPAQRAGGEAPSQQEEPERAIALLVREMQMDLEASSSSGFLGKINSARFDDFPRFREMVERLTRENTLRVFLRQLTNTMNEGSARTVLDAEMEMTRKDSAGRMERRRQQLTIDLERAPRGWKIVNITPREFFRPL